MKIIAHVEKTKFGAFEQSKLLINSKVLIGQLVEIGIFHTVGIQLSRKNVKSSIIIRIFYYDDLD